jgi:two-component system, NarL family, sensor histidine kinase UhpB
MGENQTMWTNYSLFVRLWLLLCAMILVALMASMALLVIYSRAQLLVEHEPGSRVAGQVAKAFNQALATASDPDGVLRGFDLGLDDNEGTVTFETRDEAAAAASKSSPMSSVDGVPTWFVRLLIAPNISDRFPIYVAGQRAGDLVFKANMSADLSERWLTFVGILTSAVALAIISSLIAYFTVGATLKPLNGIARGLTQLRIGDYDVRLPCEGPPEIRKSCRELNDLASTLSGLSSENTRLLRRLVGLEEQEKRDLSRELHDELGPLLFAIRANSSALLEGLTYRENDNSPATRLRQAVEALQHTNRRILDRLRPMHIRELGLQRSVMDLVKDAGSRSSGTRFELDFDSEVATPDDVVANTIYRAVQESLTNILKHAQATTVRVRVGLEPSDIVMSVVDDGIGFAEGTALGRGLTGMRERVRALGGTFSFRRIGAETVVSCTIPARQVGDSYEPS